MPIDYSKWDNLDEYSSSDDEDKPSGARVTRLDETSQVTFGGSDDGSASITPSTVPVRSANNVAAETVSSTANTVSSIHHSTAKNKKENSGNDNFSTWKTKGGLVMTRDNRRLFWSQDRYSVCIRLELVSDESIQNVQGTGLVSYADRFCAVGTTKPTLSVSSSSSSSSLIILQGDLPHPIHFAQDEDEIEWCIERSVLEERFLTITLYKAVPMQGLAIWWRRPMMEFAEIDNPDIKSNQSSTSKEFLSAWEEAHRIFRENKKKSPN